MKKTISGNIEEINAQTKEIRKTYDIKICKTKSDLGGEKGKKRIVHTVELELEEKKLYEIFQK